MRSRTVIHEVAPLIASTPDRPKPTALLYFSAVLA
jgi:hypothetical protein